MGISSGKVKGDSSSLTTTMTATKTTTTTVPTTTNTTTATATTINTSTNKDSSPAPPVATIITPDNDVCKEYAKNGIMTRQTNEITDDKEWKARAIVLDRQAFVHVTASTNKNPVLGRHWACAMPTGESSSLFKSSHADPAPSIAARLGRKLDAQIYLSLDVPSSKFGGNDPLWIVNLEKGLVLWLQKLFYERSQQEEQTNNQDSLQQK